MLILSLFTVESFLAGLSSGGAARTRLAVGGNGIGGFLVIVPELHTGLLGLAMVGFLAIGNWRKRGKTLRSNVAISSCPPSGVHADEFPREGETDDPQADGSIPA